MGLLNAVSKMGRRLMGRPQRSELSARTDTYRICRVEALEKRNLLAAVPVINVGAVYYEPHSGSDNRGNEFIITWSGGAAGTELTQLVIDTDKQGDGLTFDDTFFDTAPGGRGDVGPGNASVPLIIGAHDGIQVFGADGVSPPTVADGSTKLVLTFQGFTAGKRLFFRIDVDERAFPNDNAVAEAQEFEGSKFTVTFVHPDFQTATGTDIFTDDSDAKMTPSGLNLPPNSYIPQPPERFTAPFAPGTTAPAPVTVPDNLYTAAAIVPLQQKALPSSISGRVHADKNGDCLWQPGEKLLSGVIIELLDAAGSPVLDAAGNPRTAITDVNGMYKFDNLDAGTYTVREQQPAGYFNGGTLVGSAGGTVPVADTISNIVLPANRNATDYNFCEKLGSLSGKVYVDANADCVFQPTETLLPGVVLRLLNAAGNPILDAGGNFITAVTDANGNYIFHDLTPGVYGVEELQPVDYFEGCAKAGSLGGVTIGTNFITLVDMTVNRTSVENNFAERLGQISGQVIVVTNGDCDDPGATETPLPGVTISIFDAGGVLLKQTVTNTNGEYVFDQLKRGTYTVVESPTPAYLDADAHPGKIAGVTVGNAPNVNTLSNIALLAGNVGVNYDFCEFVPILISGYVFQDGPAITLPNPNTDPNIFANTRPGIFSADQPRIAGAQLVLADGFGNPLFDAAGNLITTFTNASGYYQFTGLLPGSYSVLEVQPGGYVDNRDTAGSLGGLVFNPGDAIFNIKLLSGQNSVMNNFSEILVQPLPFILITPPPPSLPPDTVLPPPPGTPLSANLPPATFVPPPVVDYYGNGPIVGYTWHLSVVNAGQPRNRGQFDTVGQTNITLGEDEGWNVLDLKSARFRLRKGDAALDEISTVVFGMRGAIPVAGDFNGDGLADVGIYYKGQWFIDLNGNGTWDKDDLWAKLGTAEDLPVVGDWDGDGKTDIGIYGKAWPGDPRAIAAEPGLPNPDNAKQNVRKNSAPRPEIAPQGARVMQRTSVGRVRRDLIDHVFAYGTPGDWPLAGNWNGNGADTIGVFRDGRWDLDVDGDGKFSEGDISFHYGQAGDMPVVGDFDGDGTDEIGVLRNGKWIIDTNHDRVLDDQDTTIEFGNPGDRPAVSDFDGDGKDDLGVYEG